MPQAIDNISDDDIRYAEKILLPNGKEFDEERKAFICNFNTIDLQAVPGSGKTTALLAKLLILERKFPFADGSGILVLSHTNAAIDEIKEKIQKHCPRLFSYPNFIGTTQSFVDEFLAIPYYVHKCKKKPIRIDHEIYGEVATKRYNSIQNGPAKSWLNNQHDPENLFKNLRFDTEFNLTNGINGKVVLRNNSNTKTYKFIKKIKLQILQSGILHYDDAYFLAELYLRELPKIKTILQKRFSLVFVDEMQDMDTHQYNLLEKIFYDEGKSVSIFQRIGDKNQAIYNSVKATDDWQDRTLVLRLSGSHRLSKPIANVVKNFALYRDETFDIQGLNNCEYKPHILLFDDNTKGDVIPFFARIVKDKGLANSGKPIKVICWNTEWSNEDNWQNSSKLRLEDYYKSFRKEKAKPKQDYDNLKSYLLYYEKKKILKPIWENIIKALLKILRLENINTFDNRPYTKNKLFDFIYDISVEKYDEFNLNLYNWSIGIIQEKTNEVWESIKAYTPTFLALFNKTIDKSSIFINTDSVENTGGNSESIELTNFYKVDGLEIEITSVHAVKGQTHCATLYLESYFHKDGNGANAKSYESQRLKDQFLGKPLQVGTGNRVKQSAKMVYVGFSRPSVLLCVAIHKDRFKLCLSKIDRNIWEIIEVSNK
jgi:hypothetical protein